MLGGGSEGEDDTRSVYCVVGCVCRKPHSEKLTQNGCDAGFSSAHDIKAVRGED